MKKKFIFLMMLLALIGGVNLNSLRAQETITIGSGTEVQAFLPLQANYDNTISEQIFLAEDFQGKTGSITSYAFKSAKDLFSYGTPITVTRNFKIYMINTDKASFVSSTDWVNMTDADLVFNGQVTVQPKDTWTTITFDTPFNYEVGKNVLLCIDAEGTWNALSGNYYKHNTTDVRSLVYYVDGTELDATNITVASKFDNLNYVAQTQFTFAGGSEPEQPTAPATPINLLATATGETSIALSWTAVEDATSYNVYFGTDAVATGLTTTSYTVENLTAGTQYCYNVTAVNEAGESAATADACATTNTAQTPGDEIQEIYVNNGTSSTNAAPFRTTSAYAWVEMLYKSSDIGQACTISSLSFNCVSSDNYGSAPTYGINTNVKIYLAETTKTDSYANTFVPENELTLVYEGSNVTLGDEAWETFTFSTPFEYSGTNNLVIAVSNNAGANAQDIRWACGNKANSVLFDFSDTNPAGAEYPNENSYTGGSGYTYNMLPNVKLGIGTGTTPDQPEEGDFIVVGDVNTTESTSVAPFRNSSKYSWAETYYPKEELGQAMTITSLAYKCATVNASTGYTLTADEIEIYIGETDNDNHSSSAVWVPQNELTLVYSGTNILLGEEEWESFTLDTPYEYSGTRNLAIAVSKSASSYNSAMKFASTTVAKANNYRGNDSNAAYADYPAGNGSTNGSRPIVKIGYGSAVVPEIPATPANLAATATSQSTIALTWDAVEGATEYNIYSGTETVATVTTNSYNATGLTAGTEYCYSVTAVNVAGESAASEEECATPTAADQDQYALFTDFNDGTMNGWRTIDGDGDGNNWQVSTGAGGIMGVNGSKCAYSLSYISGANIDVNNYIVTTAAYAITSGSVLEWDVMPTDNTYYEDHYGIVYSTDGQYFTTIWEETLPSVYNYEHRTFELDYLAGQTVYIGFRHYMTTDGDGICIDNIALTLGEGNEPQTAEGDTWQDAIVVTEYPFSHTPDFANLNNDYTLPGETQDGADVVYKLTFAEETTLSATVTGTNGKIALYAEDFNGQDGPGANNYYGPEDNGDDNEDPEDPDQPEGATTFLFDFNEGDAFEGLTLIDADGDNYNFEVEPAGYGGSYVGYNNTRAIMSYSWSYNYGTLTPDNYVVTAQPYSITAQSAVSCNVRSATTYDYAEHYGIVVSEDGQNWTTVHEETLTSNDWITPTISLSSYAGKNLYIGVRHFNCTYIMYLMVDNLQLTDGAKRTNRNGINNVTVPAGTYYVAASATEAFSVNIITSNNDEPQTAEGDTWQDAIVVTEYPFSHTPDFANLNNDYTLPGETQDGADVVYKLTFAEETTFNASVTGANGKLALYAEDFGGQEGPGADNYYGAGEEPEEPEVATSFSYNFNDGSLEGWRTFEYDNDGYNWEVSDGMIQMGSDGTKCLFSSSTSLTPNNYVVTTEAYAISATSTLSFEVKGDMSFYTDYYGVVVSEDGENFITIWDETAPSTYANKTVELVNYAGKNLYIGFKHFNSNYQAGVLVDNVVLSAEGGSEPEDPDQYATTFFYDFNDYSLEEWNLIDADNDGNNWMVENTYGIAGPDNSTCVCSYSYGTSMLYPDNYLVTASKYSITSVSAISFAVRPMNYQYIYDKYGVVVSEDGENWTVVYYEAFDENAAQEYVTRNVDLSSYAGKNVYIGLRHYDCNGNWGTGVLADNIQLTDGSKRGNRNSLDNVTVPAGTYYLVASATESFFVNINLAGEQSNPDLIPVAQVTATENGANVDVAWSMNRNFVIKDAKSGKSISLDETRDPSDYTFHSYKLYRANGDNTPVVLADNLTETTFQDATWSTAESGVYKWGVAAMYTANATRETTTIFSENFEDDAYYSLPEGWTTFSDPETANQIGNWYVTNGDFTSHITPIEGQQFGYTGGGDADNSYYYFVTPAIDLSSALNPTVSFSYVAPGLFDDPGNPLSVKCSESATGPWTEVWVENNANRTWKDASLDLSAFSGKTIYIAFVAQDISFSNLGCGIDNVVVAAELTDGPVPVASEIVWSNPIDKDMITTVAVNVTTDDGGSVAGTTVTLENVNEPAYVYETTLDATGQYTWNNVRKGTYEVTIELEGYYSCADGDIMEIMDATTIECTMEAKPEIVEGLYVSPTGWAMWTVEGTAFDVVFEGETVANDITDKFFQLDVTGLTEGEEYTTTVIVDNSTTEAMEYTWTYSACDNFAGVTNLAATMEEGTATLTWTLPVYENQDPVYEFSSNFDDGSLNGWNTIDADGDLRNWVNTSEHANQGFGVDNTYCASSFSYDNSAGALTPDNYLVTKLKYTITEGSTLTYSVCAQNNTWHEEHYGVAVSTTNGTDASAFTTIFEETLERGEVEPGQIQSQWFERTIDLSDYAGQTIYIAFRHFNCTNQWWINLDNVELSNPTRDEDGEWLFYDNGINESAMGFFDYMTGEPMTMYWAIMFPADVISQYAGTQITKVSMYVYEGHTGGLSIHTGGDIAPGTTVHVQEYEVSAVGEYEEIALTTPITISGTENIWIQFSNTTGGYVAAHSADCGEPNGRWMSNDGSMWYDAEWYGEGWYGTWQIRAYVEGDATPIPDDPEQAEAEVLGVMLYRNGELLTEQPLNAETYTDANLAYGNYEYEVRVVYGGEDPATHYAMSCADAVEVTYEAEQFEIIAPYNLEGEATYNADGTYGVTLEWVIPYCIVDHFNIYRRVAGGTYEKIGETESLTYYDEVNADGTYYYQVTSFAEVDGVEYESEPATTESGQNFVEITLVSIEENGVNGLTIYPNPTKDNINITAENMTRITVTNALGQVMYDQEVVSDNEIINMAQYEAGVYMVRIVTESGVAVERITVVK